MTFQWPMLLLSLGAIPILIAWYVVIQRQRRAYAVRFTNLSLLREVVGPGPGIRRHIPPLLFLLGLAALLFSLARPTAIVPVPREQATVILVIDVSGSMTANDLEPNRIVAAQQAAHTFLEALPEHVQVGLVTFSNVARVHSPPTTDRLAVRRAIDRLNAEGGTAIGDGLTLALDQIQERPLDVDGQRAPATVILLSDGAANAGIPPLAVAQRAASEDVKVYTVGIGERGAVPLVNRRTPARLDEETLQRIASATGAEYYYAADAANLEKIYATLGSLVSWVEEPTEVTAVVGALSALFLTVGGLLSLHWFQRFP